MNYQGSKSYQTYIAGGLSGLASLISIYPTEYIKSQIQFKGNQKTFQDIIKGTYHKWGVKGFYHGITPLLIGSAPRSMFKFVGYEQAHFFMRKHHLLENHADLRNFIAGSFAGVLTSCMISSPTDNIKIHGIYQQTQNQIKQNMVQNAKSIWQMQKLPGFYRGLSSTAIKESLTFGLRFTFYHRIFNPLHHFESQLKNTTPDKMPKNPITSALAGGLGGGLVCLINNPFDVTQTRMQTNYQAKYRNLPDCMRSIIKEEGILALWKGASYRSLRAVPGVMISFYVYEIMCSMFNKIN